MGRVTALSALLGLAVLATACAGGSDLEETPTDLAALTDATGLDLGTGSATAVWFTTPWCRGCQAGLAEALQVADGRCDVHTAVVIGRAGEGAMGQYLEGAPGTVCGGAPSVVIDTTGAAFGAVPVIAAPTWVFIDGAGDVTVERDEIGASALDDRLRDLAG
ncbi:MAG: hypothetical protein OES57_07150 [Acidimicrobiia bacterium]|nr:hypothetical protein [Acidimicrobiia bacterium]